MSETLTSALADATEKPHDQPPILALLGACSRGFAAEFADRLSSTPYNDLTLAHSTNVLRWLHGGPLTSTAIVQRSGVTKQAVSQQVAHLVDQGYVELVRHPDDGRSRLVRLTRRGRNAQRTVHRLFGEIERDWRSEVSEGAWDHMVAGLSHFARLGSSRVPSLD